MYRMKANIRYSECGPDNKLRLASIINYFQDCTTENSEKLGVGHAYLKEQKRAWVLNSWQVVVCRKPEVGESIEVCTWATGFKGVFGPRDFCMQTADGEVLAYAHTLWVYIDTETGRPVKPTDEEIAVYELEEPLELPTVSRKINLPNSAVVVDTLLVRKYHIDTNNHVNNSQYIQMAAEILPEKYVVERFRVEYKKAAVLGDVLTLKYKEEGDRIVVGLCDDAKQPYAIVEFIGECR